MAVATENITNAKKEESMPKTDNVDNKMLRKFPEDSKRQTIMLAVGTLVVVTAGILTGWQLSGGIASGDTKPKASNITPSSEGNVTEAGVEDTSEFETEEQGVLKEGGYEGEGTHHLEIEGVPSEKYPYLTSAVIDLQSFVDKEVKIWGKTIAGQQAGWLVDVGKIKVVE